MTAMEAVGDGHDVLARPGTTIAPANTGKMFEVGTDDQITDKAFRTGNGLRSVKIYSWPDMCAGIVMNETVVQKIS